MSKLLIGGGRLFDPGLGLDEVGQVLIEDDRIISVGPVVAAPEMQKLELVEAEGLWVLPGLMDLHVHLREPGQEHRETIASGTLAAAAGGFATVVAEPNTTPPRDTAARVEEALALANGHGVVTVLQKCCITVGQRGRQVTDMIALAQAGAAAASDDGFSVRDPEVMSAAFVAARAANLPLTVHVDGPEMVERDIAMSEAYDWPVHFSHVSLAEEVELIGEAQGRGLRVTGEATPHHLALCAEEAPRHDANSKMNPPLRSARDREVLRKALAAGVISVIASDHAPHSPAEKAVPYDQAPLGVIGLETTVGVIWTELVHKGSLDPATAVRAMTVGPAGVLRLEAPALKEGAPADITLLDPHHEWVVDPEQFHSRGRNCPFVGWRMCGKAAGTVSRGRLVSWGGMMML